jgi:hypothetical protein
MRTCPSLTFPAVILSCLATSVSATPTASELQSINARDVCEQPAAGVVQFTGDSVKLGPCLDSFGLDRIEELRITSGGGGAWETLESMRRYQGRIDLVVVRKLCASSCANYVLPAARRLRVEPDSYVLLHGSLSLRDLDGQETTARETMRSYFSQQHPDLSAHEIAGRVDEEWKKLRDSTVVQIPVQEDFARGVIACADWLEPTTHEADPPPAWVAWLLVTPEMARRCLKVTEVVEFWPPEEETAFSRELGFLRARR